MNPQLKISSTIITFNEEKKIEECIKSLLDVVDEIIIVDSYSTDNTEVICKKYPVRFIKHEFAGYVSQKNYALEQTSYNYVLSLDADERLSEELRESILNIKNSNSLKDGYVLMRHNNYCGQWMRYAWKPESKIRLWDRRKAKWGGTDPHDRVHMNNSDVGLLKGKLLHYSYTNVDEHIAQINKFSKIAAYAKFKNNKKANFFVHLILSPLNCFLKEYFLHFGFLDGYYGYIYCKLSASLTFFKYARLYEYQKKGLPDEQEVFATAETTTN